MAHFTYLEKHPFPVEVQVQHYHLIHALLKFWGGREQKRQSWRQKGAEHLRPLTASGWDCVGRQLSVLMMYLALPSCGSAGRDGGAGLPVLRVAEGPVGDRAALE